MKLTLIAMGPGDDRLLTHEAAAALRGADCLIGSPRLLSCASSGAPRFPMTRPGEIAALLRERGSEFSSPCVLLSGDTGFYSGARSLLALLGEETDAAVLPGVSSVQAFAARLRQPWQDWKLVSAHGVFCNPAAHVRRNRRTFFLTGGAASPAALCAQLDRAGLGDVIVTVGENLSSPDEAVRTGTARALSAQSFAPLSVMLAENASPYLPAVPGVRDEAFTRGGVPMTKSEVRSLVLCKLGLRRNDVFWDVGAGTGSVSVEAALLLEDGQVCAVERNEEGCALIQTNAERFGVALTLAQGTAPEACADFPAPDAAFIGGSGGKLEEILHNLLERNPGVRVAVTAVTIETVAKASALLDRLGFQDVERIEVAVSRMVPAGPLHRLQAENPVFLLSGRGPGA